MKILNWMVIMMVSLWGSTATRAPAVAGAFYSADAGELRTQIEDFLDRAGGCGGASPAIVVPHAGYVFSGATAARSFVDLDGGALRRVILLGPSHHARFSGGALPRKSTTAFATPLGEVGLDAESVNRLRASAYFDGPGSAHDREHCLEVELPFLQVVAPNAKIVPVLIGEVSSRSFARSMARELAGLLDEHTAVVVSTDFSHHGANFGWAPYPVDDRIGDRLMDLAAATGARAAALDGRGFWEQIDVSGDTVCGKRPVAVLIEMLDHAFEGRGDVKAVTTSGHVLGGFDQSVSYVSISYDGEWSQWRETEVAEDLGELSMDEKSAILDLARATFRTHIGKDASLAKWFAGHEVGGRLEALAGAFVTVHNTGEKAETHGRLRACMGVIEARKPLVDAVISSAVSAAHDPRFPELTLDELDAAHLEVSVLSPTHRVSGFSEIEVGTHGVVLSKNGRGAVFLPQVATEQGWDRATMLSHLARKAGLSQGAWKQGADFDVFTAQVFAEHE